METCIKLALPIVDKPPWNSADRRTTLSTRSRRSTNLKWQMAARKRERWKAQTALLMTSQSNWMNCHRLRFHPEFRQWTGKSVHCSHHRSTVSCSPLSNTQWAEITATMWRPWVGFCRFYKMRIASKSMESSIWSESTLTNLINQLACFSQVLRIKPFFNSLDSPSKLQIWDQTSRALQGTYKTSRWSKLTP